MSRSVALVPLLALALAVATPTCRQPTGAGAGERSPFVPAPGSPLELGADVGRPVLADLDADGVLDLVVPYDGEPRPGDLGRVAVFLGRGDGGFRTPPSETSLPRAHLKLAAGDVDGDGHVDLAVAAHDSYAVRLLLGDGRGGLRAGGDVVMRAGTTPHTHSIALADVDADGQLDLVTANADHGDVSVALGDGRGGFAPAPGSPFPAGPHPYESLVVRDVDGDGRADVAVPLLHGSAVAVLAGDGRGGFAQAPGSPYAVPRRPGSVAAGDVDGDGRTDLVATHDDEALLSVLRGTGASFALAPDSPLRLDGRAWDARIVDLDGDGRDDVVLGGVETDVLVLRADGSRARVRDAGRAPLYLAVGDLDGDGRPDVVTGNIGGNDVSVLLAR